MSSVQKTVKEINKNQQDSGTPPRTEKPPSSRSRKRGLRDPQSAITEVIDVLSADVDSPLVLELDTYYTDSVRQARERIIREVKLRYNKDVWARDEILKDAFKNVWENRRDDSTRVKNGKKDQHRQSSRRNKRVRVKLNERLKALKQWSTKPATFREKFLPVIPRELTSPEVSDEEDSSRRFTIPFAWESDEFADEKAHLDSLVLPTCLRYPGTRGPV